MMSLQWILFIMVSIIILQGWLYSRFGLKKLYYSRFFNREAVFEGEEVQMVERIINRKILPAPWLRIESRISDNLVFGKQFNLDIKHQQFHKSLFSMMPYTCVTRRHTVKCMKRGYYRLNSVSLTMGDLFGVQQSSKTFELDSNLLVYPRLLSMDEIDIPSHSWQGDITVKRWIVQDPFMISGVRDYAPGDPLNIINWKATARVSKMQVHNFDYTANPRLLIYLNIENSEDIWEAVTEPELIERGISIAASIALYALNQGISVGFGTNAYLADKERESVRIDARSGNEHFYEILQALAKIIIDRRVTFFTFMEEDIQKGISENDILIITSFISERMEVQIAKLREYGNAVQIINIRDSLGGV